MVLISAAILQPVGNLSMVVNLVTMHSNWTVEKLKFRYAGALDFENFESGSF